MTRLVAQLGMASLSALGLIFALKVEPTSHDFGTVPLGDPTHVYPFTITETGGDRADTTELVGANAGDFYLKIGTCKPGWAGSCVVYVGFSPTSEGPKTAQLDVRDNKGRKVSASLKGTGAVPLCLNNVVFCNYAFLYTGNFDWTSASETVKVRVVDGVATCNGSATFQGRPKGIVSGTGLVAVEFVRGTITDSTGNEGPERLVYRVTVACPSPAVPATPDAAASPSRPAELGDFFQQSYNQPAATVAARTLVGSVSSPVEGEGTVSVSWSLMRR